MRSVHRSLVALQDVSAWCREASRRWDRPVLQCTVDSAVDGADLVVSTTRSKLPVFDGLALQPAAAVIAVGTSLPTGTELDYTTLSRAARVIVECKPQSLVEAGEVVIGLRDGALDAGRIADLVEFEQARAPWREHRDDIAVFKSVGVGLTDLADAALAWQAWRGCAAQVLSAVAIAATKSSMSALVGKSREPIAYTMTGTSGSPLGGIVNPDGRRTPA